MLMKFVKGAIAAVSLAALLGACGGGGVGSGGSGAPVGYAGGTVTGFGSVIVDGTPFNNDHATVQVERGPGDTVSTELKLGQQVELSLSSNSVAESIRVEAQVVGPVSAVQSDGLTVLSQTVKINADPNAGPVTLLVGYASLAEVQLNDAVEVHGVIRRDATGATYVQASRIEKLAALPTYLRVAGVVSDLGMSGARRVFKLGQLSVDYTDASVVPASRELANGQSVVVFINAAAAGQQPVAAQSVRIKQRENHDVDAFIGGVVGNLDTANASFELNGMTVRYAGALVTPASRTLANGQYVQARGSFASDGSLNATHVRIRNKQDSDISEVELTGTISGHDATAKSFVVRGVTVVYANAQIVACNAGLSDGLNVQVTAGIVNGSVQAERVRCLN